MRFGFLGTPEFSAAIGRELIHLGYSPQFVLTRTDKPRERGQKIYPSPVKQLAKDFLIPCIETERIDEKCVQRIKEFNPDTLVVVAFGIIIPDSLLDLPPFGVVNIHTSLLPRWRGAAPVIRAIQAGDSHTGVTLMRVSSELDAGAILVQEKIPISLSDTAGSILKKMQPIGAELVSSFLKDPQKWKSIHQDKSLVSYAHKIDTKEALLDWHLPAHTLMRKIHAFNPTPGCRTYYNGRLLKIFLAETRKVSGEKENSASVGEIIRSDSSGVHILCGQEILVIKHMQYAGSKKMFVRDIKNLPTVGVILTSNPDLN